MLDGKSDVSIDAHFTKSTDGNNGYHMDIHQELDRFRDTNEIESNELFWTMVSGRDRPLNTCRKIFYF